MANNIVSDTFETLGQTAGQVVKQTVAEPVKIAETAAAQVGVNSATQNLEQGQSQPSQAQQVKSQKEKIDTKRKLTWLENELAKIRQKKAQELPKQVTGKAGFSEEKLIKQIENKPAEKPEESLVVAQAKQKGGTGERRNMGGSG